MERRDFLQRVAAWSALAGCGSRLTTPVASPPRLTARPGTVAATLASGVTRARAGSTELVAYLPASASGRERVPLMVFLHGALRTVEAFVDGLRPFADEAGVMVLAPFAAVGTWDAIQGAFGPDVRGVDAALAWAFGRRTVDASRVAMSGFSDGGTYALAMGRANGDLFSRIVAYAPGFLIDVPTHGRPPVVIAHGTQDPILPYAYARDVIAPTLRGLGHEVDFRSFEGGHAVSATVAREQMRLLGGVAPG